MKADDMSRNPCGSADGLFNKVIGERMREVYVIAGGCTCLSPPPDYKEEIINPLDVLFANN
jgi:hypothetical protein